MWSVACVDVPMIEVEVGIKLAGNQLGLHMLQHSVNSMTRLPRFRRNPGGWFYGKQTASCVASAEEVMLVTMYVTPAETPHYLWHASFDRALPNQAN